MLSRSTIQHLRFTFSLFLMPVYWFAISQANVVTLTNAVLIFVILHLLVYPASNGYNSYMDNDKGSIGGIKHPLPVNKELLYVSVAMDVTALLLSLLISANVAVAMFIYITASRLYSYRGIRLKKYPVTGYLTVIICQGALVYYIVSMSVNEGALLPNILFPAIISSLLIGGTYPLTQVYQHQQDKADGVTTLSYILGVKGTFLYCSLVLLVAVLLLTVYFTNIGRANWLLLYLIATAPVLIYFISWFLQVNKNLAAANFKNLMKMNYVASLCSNAAFIGMTILKQI